MFYQEIFKVLPLIDLIDTSRQMKITQWQLREKIEDHSFTFEECCLFIKYARQPTLLRYMMALISDGEARKPSIN